MVSCRESRKVLIPLSNFVTVTPVVNYLGRGKGPRQKILIHPVFNRSVKVWTRYEGPSCIQYLPYLKFLGLCFSKEIFLDWEKFLVKDGETRSFQTWIPGSSPGTSPWFTCKGEGGVGGS